MVHAEASARTVEAAVTAAAAKLGLRSDQVDVEVLQDPVPSTFGVIGSPAQVRVTPRRATPPPTRQSSEAAAGVSPVASHAATGSTGAPAPPLGETGLSSSTASETVTGSPTSAASAEAASSSATPGGVESASAAPEGGPGPSATLPGAGRTAELEAEGKEPGPASLPAQTAGGDRAGPVPGPSSAADAPSRGGRAAATESNGPAASGSSHPDAEGGPAPGSAAGVGEPMPTRAGGPGAGATSGGSSAPTEAAPGFSPGTTEVPTQGAAPEAAAAHSGAGSLSASTPPSSSIGVSDTASEALPGNPRPRVSPGDRTVSEPTVVVPPVGTARFQRGSRDEAIEPEMVEADTERAGDFLEGLLDALDVDGDITTWVDEVGGHIELEGSDLDMLVGANAETLDALQELTRLAVLRQSKRRVRLLLDINGFRARQRERLISIVNAAVEQVIATREAHEFQPMTPAERKIVHDAVAARDGADTESVGEEPNRRVVIRPT